MIHEQYEEKKCYEILENLNSLDFSKLSHNSSRLRKNIKLVLDHCVITGRYIPVNDGRFHRSISYEKKPENLVKLKYPPEEKACLSRANLARKPVFYCSGDPRSTIFEMKIKPGDTFVLSKWTCKREIPVLPLGYSPESFEKLRSSRICPALIPDDRRSCLENKPLNIKIKKFLDAKFSENVLPENNQKYFLTAMIAEYFLSRYNNADCGIVYPTVAMRGNAENFVFTPAVMDKSFNFYSATWYRVDEADYNVLQFKVSKLAIAKSADKNGYLIWENISNDEPKYL